MSASTSPPPRLLIAILSLFFVGYLGWGLYQSITDILSFDDFEVYHYIGSVAADRTDNIYELKTPHQQRGPFLYPPSAAVLFVPLSWLSHDVAGVLFAIVKMVCLPLLWFGGVWFSGRRPADVPGVMLCMLATAIMLHRAVFSDIGNGQINMIIALAAVGGVGMIMLRRRGGWWLAGSLLLAWSIAIKLTPALLLAALLLNRKWKALIASAAFAGILLVALPLLWFGPEGYDKLNRQNREIAARFTFDWSSPHEQTTPTELFQFARLQNGHAKTTPADAPDVLPVPISGYAGERLFSPEYRPSAMRFWFATGLLVGLAYLLWRWRLVTPAAAGAARDWTWDVAMLCSLIVLLSPRVQKAHMVMLIVPAAWLAARIGAWFAPDARPNRGARAMVGVIAYGAVCVLFLVGDSLKIPIRGWDEPARCLPLVALVSLTAMIAIVGWLDARDERLGMYHAAHA